MKRILRQIQNDSFGAYENGAKDNISPTDIRAKVWDGANGAENRIKDATKATKNM